MRKAQDLRVTVGAFAISPFGDNPPGHYGGPNFPGPGLSETDSYTLLRDGATVSTGPDPLFVSVPIASGPAAAGSRSSRPSR